MKRTPDITDKLEAVARASDVEYADICREAIAVIERLRNPLDHATLTQLLDYDPETGIFRWKVDRPYKVHAGDVAGTMSRGYIQLCIFKRYYAGHRLAWFYVHGVWPKKKYQIDHINLVKTDNRIANLREVTKTQNNRNLAMRLNNKVGLKGVCKWHKKFTAYITVDGKTKYLGLFNTPEEAHAAYAAASQLHHGEYGRSC